MWNYAIVIAGTLAAIAIPSFFKASTDTTGAATGTTTDSLFSEANINMAGTVMGLVASVIAIYYFTKGK